MNNYQQRDTWIAIAYMDRERDQKVNNERYQKRLEEKENDKSRTSWNKLVDWLTDWYMTHQEYVHCELAFPDPTNDSVCTAYGVFSNCGVFASERTFGNPSYQWIFLSVTCREAEIVREFCRKQLNKPFNSTGPHRAVIWPQRAIQSRWWCVSFTVSALQTIGIMKYYRGETMDVDDVITIMEQHRRVMTGVLPSRLKHYITQESIDPVNKLFVKGKWVYRS